MKNTLTALKNEAIKANNKATILSNLKSDTLALLNLDLMLLEMEAELGYLDYPEQKIDKGAAANER